MNLLGKISLILGTSCVLLTFALKLAFAGWMPYIGFGLGFGLFFFLFALATNIKFLKALLRSESLHFVLKSLSLCLLVVGILFFLNFIVAKQKLSFDLTANKIHSLPKLTKALIGALPEDFHFYYFHVGNAKVRGYESQVRTAMLPYLEISDKLHLQSFDIFKRPDLAKKFKVGNEESALFAEYKGRITRVNDLNESAITNTLLRLTKPLKKIYFVEANDERKISDSSTFGLKGIKDQLERLHYSVSSLGNLDTIPEDTALLAMVGPSQKLSSNSLKNLAGFLKGGGSLFLALDPGEEHGLKAFLSDYGIEFGNEFVFSSQAQAAQSELLVLTHRGSARHEVAQTLVDGANPALFIASTLKKKESEGQYKVEPILEHLPNSIGRKDIDPKSQKLSEGRQFAGLVSEGVKDSLFRLAVVADSDFLTNQFYSRPGNFDLALGIFNFLSKDEDLLKMKVPVAKTTYLVLTQTQLNIYFIFFILPLAVVFFLIALFFKMRRLF